MNEISDDDKTYHIKLRSEAGGDEEPGETPSGEGETGTRAEPPGEPGSDEPVVISVEGSGPETDGEAPPIVLPPIEETVERSKYVELLREHRRVEDELKKAQGLNYQEKVRVQQAEERVTEQKNQVLRLQAEFQNYRRRVEKEREEAARFAHAELLTELLPVLDNLDRAMSSPPRPETLEDFHKGVLLIHKQVRDVLGRHELRTLETVGVAFDPNFHEAVTRVPSREIPVDHVVQDLQRGYLYKDRLLRPALVAVSEGAPDGEPAPPTEAPATETGVGGDGAEPEPTRDESTGD